MKPRATSGFTLLEVMIALAILAGMSLATFMATNQTLQSKENTEARDETNHSVALAMRRMSDDLNMAVIVKSKDLLGQNFDGEYAFEGADERVDFVSFSHLRYVKDAKESDVVEISYYLAPMPDSPDKKVLMRRESTQVDKNLQEGGASYPILENVDAFSLEYLDPKSGDFKKVWDSKSLDFNNQLPKAVKIQISTTLPNAEEKTTYTTFAPIELSQPILF